jgi:hypothetical protein
MPSPMTVSDGELGVPAFGSDKIGRIDIAVRPT